MREITIHATKSEFEPGETIEGYVVIDCDESFDCNRVVIRLRGIEKTRVVRGSGKHKRVYTEERIHIDKKQILKEFPIFQEGETGLDFQFEIPREIPASYEGMRGHIRYELIAKIELSWRLDPKQRMRLKIKSREFEITSDSQPVTSFIHDDGVEILTAEALDNTVTLGEKFAFSFRVDREIEIRGVRAEFIRREHVSPKGKKETFDWILSQRYFENENLAREMRIETELHVTPDLIPTFKTALIRLEYILKVTLDIPWRFDKSVEIPILLMPSGKQIEEKQDYFGFEFE
jgi:hypothetical protein